MISPEIEQIGRTMMNFGKYRNKTIVQVYHEDISYLGWMIAPGTNFGAKSKKPQQKIVFNKVKRYMEAMGQAPPTNYGYAEPGRFEDHQRFQEPPLNMSPLPKNPLQQQLENIQQEKKTIETKFSEILEEKIKKINNLDMENDKLNMLVEELERTNNLNRLQIQRLKESNAKKRKEADELEEALKNKNTELLIAKLQNAELSKNFQTEARKTQQKDKEIEELKQANKKLQEFQAALIKEKKNEYLSKILWSSTFTKPSIPCRLNTSHQ